MGSRGLLQAQADPRRDTQQSSSQSSTNARHARRRRSGGASCPQRGSLWQRVCSGALLLAALTLLHGPGPRPAAAEAVEENTFISDTERFPGWRGTLPGVKYAAEQAGGDPNRARTMAHGSLGEVEWNGEVQQLSWSPRLFLYKRFLSEAECDHLMNKARPHLEKSEVVDNDTGGSKSDEVRTSSGAFFDNAEDPVIASIEARIARVSFLPEENGEGLQVLRYEKGQQYRPHHDFFWDTVNSDTAHGGQRIATVLMYLSTPEEGGETVFPQGLPRSSGSEWSDCAKQGLSVKSTRGDAVLFYALHPNGTTDLASEHGSCPTLKGEKWSSTKWIHVASLRDGAAADAALLTGCHDADKGCEDWAWNDECTKNPGFMLAKCKRACGACARSAAEVAAMTKGSVADTRSSGAGKAAPDQEDGGPAEEEEDPADQPVEVAE